jgi:hypothetical protein
LFAPQLDTNRALQFHKRSQQFVSVHNETLSIAAMGVNNPDRSPLESTADTQPQLQPALLRLSAMISQFFTDTAGAY